MKQDIGIRTSEPSYKSNVAMSKMLRQYAWHGNATIVTPYQIHRQEGGNLLPCPVFLYTPACVDHDLNVLRNILTYVLNFHPHVVHITHRSEERRVGKEC